MALAHGVTEFLDLPHLDGMAAVERKELELTFELLFMTFKKSVFSQCQFTLRSATSQYLIYLRIYDISHISYDHISYIRI